MLNSINLAQIINPEKVGYKTDTILKKHNSKVQKKSGLMFNQDSTQANDSKMIVPIKQYSNKFLRQSAFKQNQNVKGDSKPNRFTSMVNKHKAYQRKYQNMLNKKHYICKTQPNQNQYQCFTTSHNFYKVQQQSELDKVRVKTDCMIQKHTNHADLSGYQREVQKDVVYFIPFQEPREKVKSKQEIPKKEEKISTSRALQLFSRIISKDKGELLDRMKSSNHKRLVRDRIMVSSKNLEAKQIILVEKKKKYSFVEKGQNKISTQTGLKYRKKKRSNVVQLFQENQKFQICGWDIDSSKY